MRDRVRRRRRRDEELLIDPDFFLALPRIRQVWIQPKVGRFRNELNLFRYDVALHLEEPPAAPEAVDLNWPLTLDQLRSYLDREQPPALVLRGVPDRRLAPELQRVEELADRSEAESRGSTVADLRSALRVPAGEWLHAVARNANNE